MTRTIFLKQYWSPLFLNWWSAYQDLTETQAHLNLDYNHNITLVMLTIHGANINPVIQATIGQHAYFNGQPVFQGP